MAKPSGAPAQSAPAAAPYSMPSWASQFHLPQHGAVPGGGILTEPAPGGIAQAGGLLSDHFGQSYQTPMQQAQPISQAGPVLANAYRSPMQQMVQKQLQQRPPMPFNQGAAQMGAQMLNNGGQMNVAQLLPMIMRSFRGGAQY